MPVPPSAGQKQPNIDEIAAPQTQTSVSDKTAAGAADIQLQYQNQKELQPVKRKESSSSSTPTTATPIPSPNIGLQAKPNKSKSKKTVSRKSSEAASLPADREEMQQRLNVVPYSSTASSASSSGSPTPTNPLTAGGAPAQMTREQLTVLSTIKTETEQSSNGKQAKSVQRLQPQQDQRVTQAQQNAPTKPPMLKLEEGMGQMESKVASLAVEAPKVIEVFKHKFKKNYMT